MAEKWAVEIAPSAAPVRPPRFGELLSIVPFRRLWLGQAVSYFGDMMNTTGLAIMLFIVTGSASVVALGLIAKAVPTILFGLLAGPVVDRFNRQRLMVAADLMRAVLTITIPFLAMNWLPGVFLVVFLIATASTVFNPAKQAMIPNLVPSAFLVKANSLVTSSERAMELLGYAAAGLIAAAISWMPLFLIDAATYLFSAATLLGVTDAVRNVTSKRLRILADVRDGMTFVLSSRVLKSTIALTGMVALFAGMTFPTLVVMAYGALKAGPFGYGLLEAMIGAGAVVGALAAPQLLIRYRAGRLILAGVAGCGAAYAATGVLRSLPSALIFLFVCGAASTIYFVPLISVIQREAPDFVRGRVMSTRFLVGQAGLLIGMAISGPLSDRIGAPLVFAAAGTLLLCAGALGFAFKDLREASLAQEPTTSPLSATAVG